MKKLLCILLSVLMLLPVLSLAELDEEELDIEEFDPDIGVPTREAVWSFPVALEDMNRKRQAAGGESVTQKFNQAEGRSQDSRLRSALAGFPRGVFTLDLPFVSEDYKLPEAVMDIRTAYFSDAEEIPLAAAVGRVSASFVSVFPPEIPLLVPGERIGEPEVSLLQVAAGRGFTVHGLNSGRIKVVR